MVLRSARPNRSKRRNALTCGMPSKLRRFWLIALSLAAACAAAGAAAAQPDGPYVLRSENGRYEAWSVEVGPDGEDKRVAAWTPRAALPPPAGGASPAFAGKRRPPAGPAPDAIAVAGGAPIFV